ncbi:MAG: efflux transporter outer membrane subunit [Calditrichia bacterium]
MRWLFLWVVVILFTSGCASNKPSEEAIDKLLIPPTWTSQQLSESDINWWNEFQSSSLDSLLSEAFRNNYDLQIAAANLKAAAAQATIQGADLFPHISAGGSATRRKQNFIGFPIPGAPDGSVATNLTNTFGVNLSASWEIDLWGRLWKQRSAGTASFQAAEADYRGAQLSLMAQVCKSWFATVEAKRQVGLALASKEAFNNSYLRTKQRYEAGLISSLDLRRSMSNLALAEATLNQRRAQYDIMVRQLETLLGRYPAAILKTAASLPRLEHSVPSGLPADLVTRRPDLQAAEQRLLAAKATTSSAKRALLPRISLTGSTGTSTDELKNLLKGDFSVWSLAGNILQPIFQGGRLRANVKLAGSREAAQQATYLRAALTAFAEVESALANEGFLREREAALLEATEQAIAASELAETQYSRGVIDYLSLLDTQRSAYDTESRLISVRRERLNARIDLHVALGGGFENEFKTQNQ